MKASFYSARRPAVVVEDTAVPDQRNRKLRAVVTPQLLSGSLKCGSCGGAIALGSGKGSGYYGCLNASRRACENKSLLARKRLEDKFVAALNEKVLNAELLEQVYQRTAIKVKELFAHVPEELRLEKIELNRAETRVHNFIEFIASGRASPSLADALSHAEQQVKTLSMDVESMEAAKDHAFTPRPCAWIVRTRRTPYAAKSAGPQNALREFRAEAGSGCRRGQQRLPAAGSRAG